MGNETKKPIGWQVLLALLVAMSFSLAGCLDSSSDDDAGDDSGEEGDGDGDNGDGDDDGDGDTDAGLTVHGLAGGALNGASVTFQVGGESYSVSTDSLGRFVIEISDESLNEFAEEDYVYARAEGTAEQDHLVLESRVGQWQELADFIEDDELHYEDFTRLQLDSLRTALSGALVAANDGNSITDWEAHADLVAQIDNEGMGSTAVLIEMLMLDSDVGLPDGIDDTAELARNPQLASAYISSVHDDFEDITETAAQNLGEAPGAGGTLSASDRYSPLMGAAATVGHSGPWVLTDNGDLTVGQYERYGLDAATASAAAGGAVDLSFDEELIVSGVMTVQGDDGEQTQVAVDEWQQYSRVQPLAAGDRLHLIGVWSQRFRDYDDDDHPTVSIGEETLHSFRIEHAVPAGEHSAWDEADWADDRWLFNFTTEALGESIEDMDGPRVDALRVRFQPQDDIADVERGGWQAGKTVGLALDDGAAILDFGTEKLKLRVMQSWSENVHQLEMITLLDDSDISQQRAEQVMMYRADPNVAGWSHSSEVPGFYVAGASYDDFVNHRLYGFALELRDGGEGATRSYDSDTGSWQEEGELGWVLDGDQIVIRRCLDSSEGWIGLTEEPDAGTDCEFFYDRRTLTVENWLEGNLLISLEYREMWDTMQSYLDDETPVIWREFAYPWSFYDDLDDAPTPASGSAAQSWDFGLKGIDLR